MRMHLRFKALLPLAAVAMLLALASCTADSPTEPQQQPPPSSGGGGVNPSTTWNITLTSSRPQLEVNGTRAATITIRVRDSVNGSLPPDGATAVVTTTLGELGIQGSGAQQATVALQQGAAAVLLFPGDEAGTANVTARLEQSFGQINIPIVVATTPEATATPAIPVFFLDSVEPNEGGPEGGYEVRIRGQEIETPVRVFFGGIPAEVLGVTSTQIRVRVPRNDGLPPPPAVGRLPVDVSVTINVNEANEASDTLVSGFTYTRGDVGVQPVIFSVTPNVGPNEGGTRVTINGDGFQSPVQVMFEGPVGLEAQVESVSRTQIVAIAPAATGFGSANQNQLVAITVRNLTNGLTVTRDAAFRYGIVFALFNFDPTHGPASGGTRVTLFGEGFDEPLVVDFGGIRQQVLSVTGNQILVRTVPVEVSGCSAPGGLVLVTHLETNQTASVTGAGAVRNFTYDVERPEITSTSPATIPQTGGVVRILGTNFNEPVRVTIDTETVAGQPASPARSLIVNSVSSSEINASVPALPDSDMQFSACDDNGDGFAGQRFVTTPATINAVFQDSGCSDSFLVNVQPTNTACRNDIKPTPTPTTAPPTATPQPTPTNTAIPP